MTEEADTIHCRWNLANIPSRVLPVILGDSACSRDSRPWPSGLLRGMEANLGGIAVISHRPAALKVHNSGDNQKHVKIKSMISNGN